MLQWRGRRVRLRRWREPLLRWTTSIELLLLRLLLLILLWLLLVSLLLRLLLRIASRLWLKAVGRLLPREARGGPKGT